MAEKLDNLHCDFSSIDGLEKDLNVVITARDDGKTTNFLMKKFWEDWKRTKSPLILIFRNIVDIKKESLQYYANLMNKFLDDKIELEVSQEDCKSGIGTAYWKKERFFHFVALSVKEATLKKTAFPDAHFILFDELEINPKNKEKYLKNEYGRFCAFFGTQMKLSKCKFYGLTNPYSRVNPFFLGFGADTSKIELGKILKGKTWAIWYKKMNPLLLEKIKEKNPLYNEESEYRFMALDGEMILDNMSHVAPMRGKYRLETSFVYNGERFGAYRSIDYDNEEIPLYYIKKEKDFSKRRLSYAFSFEDLISGSVIADKREIASFAHIKQAMRNQDVDFDSIETEQCFNEIYYYL